MFFCKNINVKSDNTHIVKDVSAIFLTNKMNAIIGPSGCGKTTFIKALLSIINHTGEIFIDKNKIEKISSLVGKIGFVQQFTNTFEKLKVSESIEFSIKITSKQNSCEKLNAILKQTGLTSHKDKFISKLSGGQLRRLGLAIELANDPDIMICDEVTSGLDPQTENTILSLMDSMSKSLNKTFICIIHNLQKLSSFDWISVLYEGSLVYQGTFEDLKKYFNTTQVLDIYDILESKQLKFWIDKWNAYKDENSEKFLEQDNLNTSYINEKNPENYLEQTTFITNKEPLTCFFSQFLLCLKRRTTLLFRDQEYLILLLAITFGFPLLVVIFSLNGLPEIKSMALMENSFSIEQIKENMDFLKEALVNSSLVSSLILFQMVLITLMASNNSAKEIAGERSIYEKERLAGLNCYSYAFSKIVFTCTIALFQGIWMALFVKYVCGFPGSFLAQSLIISSVCISMTSICLAISAFSNSIGQSNLLSIYLVGFQLPLSGIVLALPLCLTWICRSFISTYWGWSGYMSSMKDFKIYDSYQISQLQGIYIPSLNASFLALLIQFIIACTLVFYGCKKRKFN